MDPDIIEEDRVILCSRSVDDNMKIFICELEHSAACGTRMKETDALKSQYIRLFFPYIFFFFFTDCIPDTVFTAI